MALQSHDVEAGQPSLSASPGRHSKWKDTRRDPSHLTDKSIGADANELVQSGESAFADRDMSSQSGVVAEDYVISDLTIMSRMTTKQLPRPLSH
jgi:hypothetical protein